MVCWESSLKVKKVSAEGHFIHTFFTFNEFPSGILTLFSTGMKKVWESSTDSYTLAFPFEKSPDPSAGGGGGGGKPDLT